MRSKLVSGGRSLVMLSAVAGALGLGALALRDPVEAQERAAAAPAKAPVEHAKALSEAFRRAAEEAVPTVVTVRTRTKNVLARGPARGGAGQENPFKGTPFEDFFSDNEDGVRVPHMVPQPRDGVGSGVVIDKSGVILTNNHVVEGADEVWIHLADGRKYKAEDIKRDPQTDLAVLKIKGAEDLPAARLGDSDAMEIGDWVIAVGNPFELELTVSAGIISGKGRDLGSNQRAKYLQTDAAINPGNSGGPLVNLDGEVVGINTAIATNSGGYQGVGFAIPINLAKWVTTQLREKGSVQRAYLGVGIQEITPDLAEKFNVERNGGVLVSEVFPDTPASEAGFEAGDVITEFAGKKVRNPRELQELVERSELDSKQKVTVTRDGEKENLDVVVKVLPEKLGILAGGSEESDEEDPASYQNEELGMDVSEVTAAQARALGLKNSAGLAITRLEPNGAAYRAGLREGVLILKVGDTEVTTVEDFEEAIEKESLEEGIRFYVRTPAGNRFVVVGND